MTSFGLAESLETAANGPGRWAAARRCREATNLDRDVNIADDGFHIRPA